MKKIPVNEFLKKYAKKISLSLLLVIILSFTVTTGVRTYKLHKVIEIPTLTQEEEKNLNSFLLDKYRDRLSILKSLPYPVKKAELDLLAESAIVIDASNGNILFEKNADEIIPPASMTKLVVLYVVFQEIAKGRIQLSDIVELSPETWACNMPPHSSLMFLGKGQIVTLEELMLGSAICSGNDAACAMANYVTGGMENFIERMNSEVQALGLKYTHFVDASGYSENNTTTAREMATFAQIYLSKYPESIEKFHAKLSFTYPQEHNLPWEDRALPKQQDFSQGLPERITMPIYQKNTNPLLGSLPGCDGLKTGYINESGYNLALTATRNGTRFISVTMKGPGNNTQEGQAGRVHDGKEIMEWAFRTFQDYKNPLLLRTYKIPLVYTKNQRAYLVPAYKPEALTIPVIAAKNPENALEEVNINLVLPRILKGPVKAGQEYGAIEYYLGEHLLERIPLVSDRNEETVNFWLSAADFFAALTIR